MAQATQTVQRNKKDFQVDYPIDWCPGCGDFGILNALHQAMAELGVEPHKLVVVGGIGCSGKAQYYVNAYGVHTLHGRPLPFATGIKLANPELTVVVVSGDGDTMAIGAGHFVNAGRRNVNLTHIMFNNEVYGLTKGQASPTLPLGLRTKSLPEANIQASINPLMLALVSGYTWIGRAYAYNIKHLVALIKEATTHPGLAFLDVLQPCPTYNNIHTKDWFLGKDLGHSRMYNVQDEGYDPVIPEGAPEEVVQQKLQQFMQKAAEWGDRIPTGVLLVNRNVSTYETRILETLPDYLNHPPARRPIHDDKGRSVVDLTPLIEEVRIR